MADDNKFFVVRCVIVLLATVKTCQKKKLIRSHQEVRHVKAKLVKENMSFIYMSKMNIVSDTYKEKLLVCNRL